MNSGRALEDLRAALFNEFRSSEGAKRQQQQLCGPATALTFNFVLKVVGFQFPIFLTFIHYVVSWFLMAVLNALSILPACPPKSTRLSTLFTLGFVMAFSTGLANVSLKYNSVGFYQMSKIAVTPSIVLAEFLLYNKRVSFSKDRKLVSALAWIIPSAVNKILWSSLQQQENWTALALMWKTTPITLFFLVALIPWLDPPGALSFNWNFNNTLAILMSAILGFLLQWSGALALGILLPMLQRSSGSNFKSMMQSTLEYNLWQQSTTLLKSATADMGNNGRATSAVTHVVLGQFKTCVILLGNYYLFSSNPGKTSISGAFTAIAGMSIYTYLNLKQQSSKAPRQASSLPKSKLSKENGSIHEGNYGSESV
ncbi:unnamed protein product [Prunus armeniaca]|uniref:Sugar phosphate transporter domain-containing protein n=1 Tax=Prunus armeniaca TaxID=36596 RepID=A0A6J5TF66_PRUAR|nr:unnamed protein product [Prunus armeniaca]